MVRPSERTLLLLFVVGVSGAPTAPKSAESSGMEVASRVLPSWSLRKGGVFVKHDMDIYYWDAGASRKMYHVRTCMPCGPPFSVCSSNDWGS